jgi:DNA processing protein
MPSELPTAHTRAWLTLLRAPGLGASVLRDLLARHGDAPGIFDYARRASEISPQTRAWLDAPDGARLDADAAWLEHEHHHLVIFGSAEYPPLLLDAPNPPVALFVVGQTTHLWSPQIAIVGSRNATRDGIANAHAFAKSLAQAGNTITSGLAEGVDGAAHQGALQAEGSTIAVLGTGADIVFPRQHQALAQRIAEQGALVSEFPPGTPGLPQHFPRRNRIIAGLSLGTLVIEASLRSGSLTTARLAADAGREVFALPGSIHSPLARGCHRLIRDGAKLVETAEQVLEELHGMGGRLADNLRQRLAADSASVSAPAPIAPAYDADYAHLLAALDAQPAALDDLAERTGLSAAALSSMLLVLELDGAVSAENGRYARR